MGLIFTPVVSSGLLIGFERKTDQHHLFFGTRHLDLEGLHRHFHQFEFRHLQQVHGSQAIESSSGPLPTADAHWTQEISLALAIQTADCLPVLFASGDMVCAAHAGWRGIVGEILVQCGQLFEDPDAPTAEVAIGPHIQSAEFEVGEDVARQLESVYKQLPNASREVCRAHLQPDKRYVDLATIAAAQIDHGLGRAASLFRDEQSTLSNELFHSFRRGKHPSSRQYSFVALLK